jgi:uncharacterized membrane protein YbhN (UPF0104 family)
MKTNFRRVLYVMLLGVVLYFAFAVFRGMGKLGDRLGGYAWWTFAVACALAFGNYVLRFVKWEFYLARLGVRGVSKGDSFLTFLSGFILTVTPGKVGEVFKSVVLKETHGVPLERTAPIVIAERVTDLVGIILLIAVGSAGFEGGLFWAGVGTVLVLALVVLIAWRAASLWLLALLDRLGGPFRRIGPKLLSAYESLAVLVAPRNLLWPTALSVAAWLLECFSLWIILHGFGETTSVALSTFFYATSTLAGALVPIPIGVTEGALLQQLEVLGHVEPAAATGAMILVRFATLWFAVLVGFAALHLLRRRYPRLLKGDEGAAAVA